MALLETPSYKATRYSDFRIDTPCLGGLNLCDLEYEQTVNQSPNVLNMMYNNGAFGKRYGQEYYKRYNDTIYAVGEYHGEMIVHIGSKIYKGDTVIAENIPAKKGHFFNFNRKLYYLCEKYYEYESTWKEVVPYIPDILINRSPDGSYEGDLADNYNMLGSGFNTTFHGDGSSTVYRLKAKNLDSTTPICTVDGTKVTDFTFNAKEGTVTFKTAPVKGTNNVVITAYKTEKQYIDAILNCKYSASYGGANNSRIFLAGGGDSRYYYSGVADATYFPENNYAFIGNSEEDITGFGEQYDILMVFKPKEIYAIEYYVDSNNKGAFTTKQVNARIGCDAPNSIQLINNLLVWLSTTEGVCTLVSTNIEDERNVRSISRNINGGIRKEGLLQESHLENVVSTDFDNKYILTVNGKAYVWDYGISPYTNTGKIEQDAKRLSWFLFDNFNVKQFIKQSLKLYYSNGKDLVILNNQYNDFGNPIKSRYQTPFMQFNAVEYLKNVREMYLQIRSDTITAIDITYITDETLTGEKEHERIHTKGALWDDFSWSHFIWRLNNFANVFRRKCSLKKVQMVSVLFENEENDKDMSLTYLGFKYVIVKNVK